MSSNSGWAAMLLFLKDIANEVGLKNRGKRHDPALYLSIGQIPQK